MPASSQNLSDGQQVASGASARPPLSVGPWLRSKSALSSFHRCLGLSSHFPRSRPHLWEPCFLTLQRPPPAAMFALALPCRAAGPSLLDSDLGQPGALALSCGAQPHPFAPVLSPHESGSPEPAAEYLLDPSMSKRVTELLSKPSGTPACAYLTWSGVHLWVDTCGSSDAAGSMHTPMAARSLLSSPLAADLSGAWDRAARPLSSVVCTPRLTPEESDLQGEQGLAWGHTCCAAW